MSQKKKHLDRVHDNSYLKTPEQSIKMNTKQVNSVLRNESPDIANRAGQTNGNISSDDQEQQIKRSDGTYYISNITNNIIVDKKANPDAPLAIQPQRSSGRSKSYRQEEATQEKQCTCYLKYFEGHEGRQHGHPSPAAFMR